MRFLNDSATCSIPDLPESDSRKLESAGSVLDEDDAIEKDFDLIKRNRDRGLVGMPQLARHGLRGRINRPICVEVS